MASSHYKMLNDVARPRSLFPPVFKWIGTGVAVIGVATYVVLASTVGGAVVYYAGGTTTMLGLAVAAFSRERGEDELTRKLRLEAAYWSGMIGVGALVGMNSGVFFLEGKPDLWGSTGLMIVLLCFYLVKFHHARRQLRHEEEASEA